MSKKFYLMSLCCFILCSTVNGQRAETVFCGEVVAYIEPNVIAPPHSFVPKSDVLIVRVARSRGVKNEFIKVVAEYFSEKSPVPKGIFKGGKWKFKVARRTDCDSALSPDNSELQKSIKSKEGEGWTFTSPNLVFIKSEGAESLPKDKVLPCYSFTSAQNR